MSASPFFPRLRPLLLTLCVPLAFALGPACSGDGGGADALAEVSGGDAAADALVDTQPEIGSDMVEDTVEDATPDAPDDAPPDAPDAADSDTPAEVDAGPELVDRAYSFRVIAGVSMGANAVTIAAHHPEAFDVVGAMGGYVDTRYLGLMMQRYFIGGFCPMEQLLANLEHIDDPTNPNIFCGPVAPALPWEWAWDFNHWHYDNSGGTWDRDFYLEVIEGFMLAYGNLLYYNPDNPLTPPGVSLEWLNGEADKCGKPAVVGKPHNYNAEYNPEGTYDLITFCDGETVKCDESTAECLAQKGTYEPDKAHTRPVWLALAVDYNGNGRRDYGEPVVMNANERFDDVGPDGCGNADEDGQGGCGAAAPVPAGSDPNGDDFDLIDNPGGGEGDGEWQPGEPYLDHGLDGVAGTGDFGEGNGAYDLNPRFAELLQHDARTFFRTADLSVLERITWYFDGGIRDAIHAVPFAMFLSNALKLRGLPVTAYDDFGATDQSLRPGVACDGWFDLIPQMDLSPAGIGRNVLMRYGDPNASPELILEGDGKHVGLICQVLNRVMLFYIMALKRLPDPFYSTVGTSLGKLINSSFYSEALKSRVPFSITLPPGYDLPALDGVRYPLAIFLPGHGIAAEDMAASGLLFNAMMSDGTIPRFLLLAPEGQCCFVDQQTGLRHCACKNASGGMKSCIDPTCKGPHETCNVELIPSSRLVQECPGGHFFVNHKANQKGDATASEVMRFEDGLMELIEHVDKAWRTRPAETVAVPVEF